MDNKKLDKIFKVVVVGVGIVFIGSKVFSSYSPSSPVYGNQIVENNLQTTANISENNGDSSEGRIVDGVQVIEFDLENRAYPNLKVNVNQPVKLIINVSEENLNSCNYIMQSSDFGFEKKLEVGENIIEFTPTSTGEYVYSCWMGMVGAYITVTEGDGVPSAVYGENVSQGGCCSPLR